MSRQYVVFDTLEIQRLQNTAFCNFAPKTAVYTACFVFVFDYIYLGSSVSSVFVHTVPQIRRGSTFSQVLWGKHPMFSHGRRLSLHPHNAGQTTSGRLTLLPHWIVVEPSPARGLAADCPLFPAFRFTPCAICAFSAFATVTLEFIFQASGENHCL